MKTGTVKFKQNILELMKGSFDLENYNIPEGKYIADEFEDGKFCSEAYERVYNANRRLCERLGVEEDKDIEIIINSLLEISDYLCLKMYDYGNYFSEPSIRYS